MRTIARQLLLLSGLVVTAGVILVLFRGAAEPASSSLVSWTPRALSLTLVAGNTLSQELTLTVRGDKKKPTVVHLSPSAEIVPYVSSISPLDVEAPSTIEKEFVVSMTAAAPISGSSGTIRGVLNVQVPTKKPGKFQTNKKWTLPIIVTIIGVTPPPGWSTENIPSGSPQSEKPDGGVRVVSPAGSVFALLPFGAPGFGIDPENTVSTSDVVVDGLPGRRADYFDPEGRLLFTIVTIPTVPGYPRFDIMLRPSTTTPDEAGTLETLLNTLKLPNGA